MAAKAGPRAEFETGFQTKRLQHEFLERLGISHLIHGVAASGFPHCIYRTEPDLLVPGVAAKVLARVLLCPRAFLSWR